MREECERWQCVRDRAFERRGAALIRRGFRRWGGGGAAPTLAARVAEILVGGSWFDADHYAVDGGTGKTASFYDVLDNTHLLAQATSGNQVAVPAADSGIANARAANFTGSAFYDSNRASSTWKYLHDGTGCEIITVWTETSLSSTRILLGTRDSTTSGFSGYVLAAGTLGAQVTNGVVNVVNSTSGAGAIVNGTPTYQDFSYSETASPKYVHRQKSATLGSGSSLTAPSSGNPGAALRLGALLGGTLGASMRWRATFTAPRVLSASERSTLQSYIQSTTGIAP